MNNITYKQLAEEKILEYIGDDATFPCFWFDKMVEAGSDPEKQQELVREFADHVAASDYWTDLIEEAAEQGEEFNREMVREIAASEMRNDIRAWCELSEEDQKQYYGFEF